MPREWRRFGAMVALFAGISAAGCTASRPTPSATPANWGPVTDGCDGCSAHLAEWLERELRADSARVLLERSLAQDSTADSVTRAIDSLMLRDARAELAWLGNRAAITRVADAVRTGLTVRTQLIDFWANHFSIYAGKVPTRTSLAAYAPEVIAPHATGKFRDLLGAVAHSVQMRFYLDLWQNAAPADKPTLAERAAIDSNRAPPRRVRSGLNENYARELLELHTIGREAGYTQRDVEEVARVLTGWTIDGRPQAGGRATFRADWHDAAPKVVLGTTFAAGGGEEEGERLLDLLARHPATARRISTKLLQRFVADTPPAALVERVAATFRRTDGDIAQTVGVILASPEYAGRTNGRGVMTTPWEFVVGTLHRRGVAPDTTMGTANWLVRMGQGVYGNVSPEGWREGRAPWQSGSSLGTRVAFIRSRR